VVSIQKIANPTPEFCSFAISMSLYIASLNSGSNGNCYYIGNDSEAVLIDAGISCRETEKRMARLALSMAQVKAIFISHEHSDHIRGLDVLSRKYSLPVYITEKTLLYSGLPLAEERIRILKPYYPVAVGELSVQAFPKIHDAADATSFMVTGKGINIGVMTDLGDVCKHVLMHFKKCHATFLEANYDEEMLQNGRYPYHLKKRISGGRGHLSNRQALELFTRHKPAFMSHVLLSHLSADNNNPELVQQLFSEQAGNTEVIVASRHVESAVYTIKNNGFVDHTLHHAQLMRTEQLSLF